MTTYEPTLADAWAEYERRNRLAHEEYLRRLRFLQRSEASWRGWRSHLRRAA